MSSFDYFRKQQEANSAQNNSARVPSRPQNWAITLKHNAQTGQTSLSLNLRNRQDIDEDYQNIDVNSYEFVVLTAMQMAKANSEQLGFTRVSSNATNKGYFDVAGMTEDRTRTDLGLYNSEMLFQTKKYWSQPRLYGILRAVNDANPTAVPELRNYFGDGALPVVMDLTFAKQNQLMKILNKNRYDLESLVGKSIKVTASKTAGTTKSHGRQYYQPDFSVTSLSKDDEAKMTEYAKEPIDELMTFNEQINKQDDLYAYIFESGLRGTDASELLDQLSTAGVTSKEQAIDFITQHGGWASYTGATASETPSVTPSVTSQTTTQTTTAPAQPQPAPQPTVQPTEPESNDTEMEDLSSGELPF